MLLDRKKLWIETRTVFTFPVINSSQSKIKADRLEEVGRFSKNLIREQGNWQISPNNKEKNCEARKTLKPFYEELYGRKPEVSI